MKPIKIPQVNFTRLVLREKFKLKFGFKKLDILTIQASTEADTIKFCGWGHLSNDLASKPIFRQCADLKLSENPEYENIALKQVHKHIPKSEFKKLFGLSCKLDFKTFECKGEVLYYAIDDSKHYREFITTF